jgi:drug/metabolite transporter (DMT)-like permease
VLALSQVAGLAAVAVWLAVGGDERPGAGTLVVAAAAGLAGAVGLAALYRGMAIGAMGVVAPISAVAAAIPFAVGVATGERPGVVQLAGVALALAGVGLASRQPVHLGGGRAAGAGLALLAAAGFGLYFVLLDNAADASVAWAVVVARAASAATAIAAAVACGLALRVGRRHLPALLAIGVCDVGANVLFGLATTRGYLSVVSVLSALYPVVTMGLAALLLHERIAPSQRLGVAGALAGAAMISAG